MTGKDSGFNRIHRVEIELRSEDPRLCCRKESHLGRGRAVGRGTSECSEGSYLIRRGLGARLDNLHGAILIRPIAAVFNPPPSDGSDSSIHKVLD